MILIGIFCSKNISCSMFRDVELLFASCNFIGSTKYGIVFSHLFSGASWMGCCAVFLGSCLNCWILFFIKTFQIFSCSLATAILTHTFTKVNRDSSEFYSTCSNFLAASDRRFFQRIDFSQYFWWIFFNILHRICITYEMKFIEMDRLANSY